MEVLKKIKGYTRYYASSEGYIVSIVKKEKKKLIPESNSVGYQRVWLYEKGQPRKRYFVHRLILEAFEKPTKLRNEVNHIDRNKKNNKLKNLEWVTRSENIQAIYKG